MSLVILIYPFSEANYVDFNHLDFIWGLRAAPDVYNKIIQTIAKDGVNVKVPVY